MRTHRTIFAIELPFLDASNCEKVDLAFKQYLAPITEPSCLPVDFGSVEYMSSAIGVICYAFQPSFHHVVACMRLHPNALKLFELCGWSNLQQFDIIPRGTCPACGEIFDEKNFHCSSCGSFEICRVT